MTSPTESRDRDVISDVINSDVSPVDLTVVVISLGGAYRTNATLLGRSGRVVSASDCDVRRPKFETHRERCVIATAAVIYSLGHGLCAFTAMPRLTQPSTLCGTVNEYQLMG